jgi:hypothetical protein
MKDAASYYKRQGAMTAAGEYAVELAALPADLAALCEIVQGLLIHRDMASFLYRVTLSEQRVEEAHIRPVAEMLTHIHALDSRTIKIARETDRRMACVCRHFAILLTAILRERGIAARARCGFGAYFTPGKFEDHWVCEYWNPAKSRWILVDAQMDRVQREAFHLDFDPLDVPRDRFIIAGDAWRMCREGGAAPNRFGLSHIGLQGLWFVAGNVVRDFAALNRMEMLPWDVWGAMPKPEDEVDNETLAVIDRIAALTIASDDALPEIHSIYDRDDRLHVPHVVFNALRNAPEVVTP